MNDREALATWLILFGSGEVRARDCFVGVKENGVTTMHLTDLRTRGYIKYSSSADRPDFFQITPEGIAKIGAKA